MIAAGNLGNLLLIIVHAICREKVSPFGENCSTVGLSYASFSMAVSPFLQWFNHFAKFLICEINDILTAGGWVLHLDVLLPSDKKISRGIRNI